MVLDEADCPFDDLKFYTVALIAVTVIVPRGLYFEQCEQCGNVLSKRRPLRHLWGFLENTKAEQL